MFPAEAKWIGEHIRKLVADKTCTRLLNVGSSTQQFREKEQPHIHENIFKPIEGYCHVDHLDLKEQAGVDLVGDLTNPEFLKDLTKARYDLVLCSNLLEHVTNPDEICRSIEECVRLNGHIIVTVPLVYPYHNDPIDTMFRPTVDELLEFFKKSTLTDGRVIEIEDSHYKFLLRNPRLLRTTIIRIAVPFYKFSSWKKIVSDVPRTFKKFQVTCVLLKKEEQI